MAEHRTRAAHLKHQPLDHEVARRRLSRHQHPRLLGQMHENGARFEHRVRGAARPVMIDNRRNLVVGTDLHVLGLVLIARAHINTVHPIRELYLLEHDGGLTTVRRAKGVKIDHPMSPVARRTDGRKPRTLQSSGHHAKPASYARFNA